MILRSGDNPVEHSSNVITDEFAYISAIKKESRRFVPPESWRARFFKCSDKPNY